MTCNPAFGHIGDDVPALAACACNAVHNLPMWMENDHARYWIECDFCGKRTGYFKKQEEAVASWTLIATVSADKKPRRRHARRIADVLMRWMW
jgi:Zn ribbon nucleic-acid-binding protein